MRQNLRGVIKGWLGVKEVPLTRVRVFRPVCSGKWSNCKSSRMRRGEFETSRADGTWGVSLRVRLEVARADWVGCPTVWLSWGRRRREKILFPGELQAVAMCLEESASCLSRFHLGHCSPPKPWGQIRSLKYSACFSVQQVTQLNTALSVLRVWIAAGRLFL